MSRTAATLDISAVRFAPIDATRPVTDQIASELRAAILSLRLIPGQMLSENEVGIAFEASRTPVREAFAKLREDGLIETRPSRGTFVSMLSEEQMRGAQFIRESLETSVVRHLCDTGLQPASRAALEQNLEQQRIAVEQTDKDAFQRLDDEFHMLLAEATGIVRLSSILSREKTYLNRLRMLSLDTASHFSRLLSEHEVIFEAIVAEDERRASSLMQLHLQTVLDVLSRLVDAHREYFKPEDSAST